MKTWKMTSGLMVLAGGILIAAILVNRPNRAAEMGNRSRVRERKSWDSALDRTLDRAVSLMETAATPSEAETAAPPPVCQLRSVLTKSDTEEDLIRALYLMGNCHGIQAEDMGVILGVIDRTRSELVAATALWALALTPGDYPLGRVLTLYHESPSAEVRAAAVASLGYYYDASTKRALLPHFAREEDPGVLLEIEKSFSEI